MSMRMRMRMQMQMQMQYLEFDQLGFAHLQLHLDWNSRLEIHERDCNQYNTGILYIPWHPESREIDRPTDVNCHWPWDRYWL